MSDLTHKQKLERLAYDKTKVKGQLDDGFYNETENMDTFDMSGKNKQADSQYLNLMKSMNQSQKQQSSSLNNEPKDLSENPKYKGKKVTGSNLLELNYNNSSDDNSEGEEQFENEEVDANENDEDDDEEEFESEYSNQDDEERDIGELYKQIKNQKLQQNNGSDEDEDEEEEEFESEQEMEQNDGDEEEDDASANQIEEEISQENLKQNDLSDNSDSDSKEQLKQTYRQAMLGASKKTINNKKVDKLISQLDEEDKKIIPKKREDLDGEIKRAKHTRNQLLYWKQQSIDRMSLQKPLEIVKKMPLEMDYFESLESQKKYTEILLLQNLSLLLKNRSLYFDKIQDRQSQQEQDIQIQESEKQHLDERYEYLEDYLFETMENQQKQKQHHQFQVNVGKIQEDFEKSQEKTSKFIEDNILKWSQKTNLVSNTLKKTGFSQLLQTPIGQAQKAMKQSERLIVKSQLKREKFRILGKSEQNLYEETDKNIFDDADYYHELLKEQLEEDGGQMEDEEGLQLNHTKIYLLERKLKQQEKLANEASGNKKIVDRRASKARKIRFTTHQKLVNFANPIENTYILEGRNEILRSLFGEEVRLQKLQKKTGQQQQSQKDEDGGEIRNLKKRKLNSGGEKNISSEQKQQQQNNSGTQQQQDEFGEDGDDFALI